jgi:hypothetical protein
LPRLLSSASTIARAAPAHPVGSLGQRLHLPALTGRWGRVSRPGSGGA